MSITTWRGRSRRSARRAFRNHWLLASLAACSAALAGCGGAESAPEPRLPAAVAGDLAARSDRVATLVEAGDGCEARTQAEALQEAAIAAVNEGRVPPRYQEELLAAIGPLVESIECAPPPPPEAETGEVEGDEGDDEDEDEAEEETEGEQKGKGKGRGKKDD